MHSRYRLRFSSLKPSEVSGSVVFCLSRIRMTTPSPWLSGAVETRKSRSRFFFVYCLKTMRPSWGSLRSEMSRLHMILRRATSAGPTFTGSLSFSWHMPSTRYRTMTSFSWGSMWISLAPAK